MLSEIKFGPANPDNPFQAEWRETILSTYAFRNPDSNPPRWNLRRRDTIKFVISEVAMVSDISALELVKPKIKSRVECRWRHLIVHICYHKLGKSKPAIARALNYVSHDSIPYALRNAESLLRDPDWRAQYDMILRELG